MKGKILTTMIIATSSVMAQNVMSPELLWSLNRVSPIGLSADGSKVYYNSKKIDFKTEKSVNTTYVASVKTGKKSTFPSIEGKSIFQFEDTVWYASDNQYIYKSNDEGQSWSNFKPIIKDASNYKISPNGKYIAYTKEVLITPVLGKDIFKDLPLTSGKVYNDLDYRHWDTWSEGKHNHLLIEPIKGGKAIDLLENLPFDTPQKPFGGSDDYVWSPNSESIIYVCKKLSGKNYAVSTNTDIFMYDLLSKKTTNLTDGMLGYDMNPSFSPDGRFLAFTSMRRDGYESDKNDIVILDIKTNYKRNITSHWDETVSSYTWSKDGSNIYFNAPWKGTIQLFAVDVPPNLMSRNLPLIQPITNGVFDITSIVGESKNDIIITKTDMNHATEIYKVQKDNGFITAISHENDKIYNGLKLSKISGRTCKASDGKELFSWVVYPPDFDPRKKYPTLLYCQGGPQSALSQFYSYRWNFQLMAAQGYIVIAPNRRGMPGWGTQWNEDISKDWGGQPIKDYLSAIDDLCKESYVDKSRLGCIGASYGGYSVFMLAGVHNNRFKTFISHCGLFDLRSWYGTTEELWFANWDIGGAYWDSSLQANYEKNSPSNYVKNWNTPIMIIQGGNDFRVPIGQGQQAFQAAQLKGIKSRFLYFPDENHWVTKPQNGLLWQREFFGWLKETL